MDSYTGIAFSLKEYEDIAIEFARSERNIKIWREHIHRKRVSETLFDTKVFPVKNFFYDNSYGPILLSNCSKPCGKLHTYQNIATLTDITC